MDHLPPDLSIWIANCALCAGVDTGDGRVISQVIATTVRIKEM